MFVWFPENFERGRYHSLSPPFLSSNHTTLYVHSVFSRLSTLVEYLLSPIYNGYYPSYISFVVVNFLHKKLLLLTVVCLV